ncbi:MAG: hypothetical protein ACPGN3_01315 [Opitutales bacterium]
MIWPLSSRKLLAFLTLLQLIFFSGAAFSAVVEFDIYQPDRSTTLRPGDTLKGRIVIQTSVAKVTYSLENAPSGFNIHPDTSAYAWTPTEEQAGPHRVDFVLTASTGQRVVWPLNIQVGAPPQTTARSTVSDTGSRDIPTIGQSGGNFQIASGDRFEAQVIPPSINEEITFSVHNAPIGLAIIEKTGIIRWTPMMHQKGSHKVEIELSTSSGHSQKWPLSISVKPGKPDLQGLIVCPTTGSDETGDGSPTNPFQSILRACKDVKPSGFIYMRGGIYTNLRSRVEHEGELGKEITITPYGNEYVKLINTEGTQYAMVIKGSHSITDGFHMDGKSVVDHWEAMANFWSRGKIKRGGRGGVAISWAEHVTVRNCIIQDFFQKGINMPGKSRYVRIHDNIIFNIAHSSYSGGHGIHRQYEHIYGEEDDPRFYRYDISGNLIFNVEQRIYSLAKPFYLMMHLDEGKTIVMDETTDPKLKIRFKNNMILYSGTSGIRQKLTPHVEVRNNTIYSEKKGADGFAIMFPCKEQIYSSNLIYANGIILGKLKGLGSERTETFFDNFVAGEHGNVGGAPGPRDTHGIVRLTEAPRGGILADALFHNISEGNFFPADGIPKTVGVETDKLKDIYRKITEYGIDVSPTGWKADHPRMIQMVLDNVPREKFGNPVLDHENTMVIWDVRDKSKLALNTKTDKFRMNVPTAYWDKINFDFIDQPNIEWSVTEEELAAIRTKAAAKAVRKTEKKAIRQAREANSGN